MKKPLLSLICLFISSTSLANCRSLYEQDLAHRLQSHGRLTKIKKISKRSTFAAVGGAVGVHFYLLFQGQLIASALLGASVGGLAVLPVGVTFFAVSEV